MMDEGDSDYEEDSRLSNDKGKGKAPDAEEYDPLVCVLPDQPMQ